MPAVKTEEGFQGFRKRRYRSLGQLWKDLTFPLRDRGRVRKAMRGNLISLAFKERLVMAVTAVNGCRYCSYFHAKEALKAKVPQEEIDMLLSGSVDGCPREEAVALLYAQHWAESDGDPDSEVVQRLLETYGSEKAEAIDVVLRMIRMGNLVGNTWDYFLYCVKTRATGKALIPVDEGR